MLEMLGVSDAAARQTQVPALLRRMDLDGDGRVSLEEFNQAAIEMKLVTPRSPPMDPRAQRRFERAQRIFDSIDTSGDGEFLEK